MEIVSLPQERFQEIKHMMTVQTTHSLFLTWTQKFHLYIYTTHNQLFGPDPPCEMIKESPLTWNADVLIMICESPSTPVPCLVATAQPFLTPLTPFPPLQPHYVTMTTSTITVFLSGTEISTNNN
jgi:hypothetical protein